MMATKLAQNSQNLIAILMGFHNSIFALSMSLAKRPVSKKPTQEKRQCPTIIYKSSFLF